MGSAASSLQLKVYYGSERPPDEQRRRAGQQRHRCDARVDDFCRVLAGPWSRLRADAPVAWRNMRECMDSEAG